MKIGELAKRAGMTLRTLRYYEELGLIGRAVRTKGGFRLYAEDDLQKLQLIKDLQWLNLSLSQIRELFLERKGAKTGSEMAPPAKAFLRQRLKEVETRIARYQELQRALIETMDILQVCTACDLKPCKEVCFDCPAITGWGQVPLPMHVLIATS
ncbi:MAG: MerR family transcriptional regulator [candidate division NC10 bacterium]|nr:MerR family transcriptional regulator [candidate division NC10 bacterium]